MSDEKGTLQVAADRIRETAKWLTVSLAALGTVMVAGSQLSSIGSLEPWSDRMLAAVLGGALAAVGAGGILWATTWTATTPAVSLQGLTTDVPKGAETVVTDRTLLHGEPDVTAFHQAVVAALEARGRALTAHYAQPGDADLKLAADAAQNQALALGQTAGELLAVTSYSALAHRWKRARWVIIGAGVVAGLGLGLFAWAANPPEDAEASAAAANVLTAPKTQVARLTGDGVAALAETLGEDCPAEEPLTVIVLGSTAAGPDVLVDQEGCARTRLVLTEAWGTVKAS